MTADSVATLAEEIAQLIVSGNDDPVKLADLRRKLAEHKPLSRRSWANRIRDYLTACDDPEEDTPEWTELCERPTRWGSLGRVLKASWQNEYSVHSIDSQFDLLVGGWYDKGAYIQDILVVDSNKGYIRNVSSLSSEGYVGWRWADVGNEIVIAHMEIHQQKNIVHRINKQTLGVVVEKTKTDDFWMKYELAEAELDAFFAKLVGPEIEVHKVDHNAECMRK